MSSDGERGFTQTNVGFVPLLRMRGRYVFESAAFVEAELDGWTSPVPGNGREGELALGVMADVALRAGVEVRRRAELFLTLRYPWGGFRGEGAEEQPSSAWTSGTRTGCTPPPARWAPASCSVEQRRQSGYVR